MKSFNEPGRIRLGDVALEGRIKVLLSGDQVIDEALPSISFRLHSDEAMLRSLQRSRRHVMQNKRVPSFGKKAKQQSLKLKCHVNFMKLEDWKEGEKGYMRRDEDARSNPSLSWLIFCFSFCSDALSVMLIWKHKGNIPFTFSFRDKCAQ